MAHALARQTERALSRGLLQGYRTVDESSSVLRGRLRETDQLRRHHGRPLPLEVRHDDFTVDVAENRILLAALTRMLAVPGVDAEAKAHYGVAVGRYEQAEQALDSVRRPQDIERVTSLLEEGRWAMTAAKARLSNQPVPERRAPCFFDPRHGPSVTDVEWAPCSGCEACCWRWTSADRSTAPRRAEPDGGIAFVIGSPMLR